MRTIPYLLLAACLLNTTTWADPAPVVEASADSTSTTSTTVIYPQNSHGEVEHTNDGLTILKKQVDNIASMNFGQQIAQLQQQIAELRGTIDVQARDLQRLAKQQVQQTQRAAPATNNVPPTTAPTVAPATKTSTSTSTPPASEKINTNDIPHYQEAFDLLSDHQYEKAQQAFLAYIGNYPNGKYIADAHYWLGEIYNIDKNYRNAESEFQRIVANYPQCAKVTDAQLKLAMIHANTGKIDKAKTELRAITQKHPDSAVAQLANIRLQQLEQSDALD